MQFYLMYVGFQEQNCINFLVIQQTNMVLLTAMASYDCFEAIALRKYTLVYSLLKK